MRFGLQLSRPSPGAVRLLVIASILAVIAVAGFVYHPAYVILRAGPAVNTLGAQDGRQLVTVNGLPTYPTKGQLDFTTVAQFGGPGYPINVWDLLAARFDSEAEIIAAAELYPPEATAEQVKQASQADMTGSQDAASAVALHALGKPDRARVAQVLESGPAARLIKVDDVVTSVSGTKVTNTGQVTALVQRAPDPAKITIGLERAGKSLTVTVSSEDVEGRRLIGIALAPVFASNISVKINAGNVGGPSAGMMFSLAVYDKLTPGTLNGGQNIAGTGTIGLDGSVGPIGGIRHKMVGARQAGAGWFLAPEADCKEVGGHIPEGLHVTAVSTFEQAKSAVEKIAAGQGSTLPGCPG